MFDNHFDGKRVLVTGASGVKGTWLALMLLHGGAIVSGLDRRLAALRSNYTATGLAGRITFVQVGNLQGGRIGIGCEILFQAR